MIRNLGYNILGIRAKCADIHALPSRALEGGEILEPARPFAPPAHCRLPLFKRVFDRARRQPAAATVAVESGPPPLLQWDHGQRYRQHELQRPREAEGQGRRGG